MDLPFFSFSSLWPDPLVVVGGYVVVLVGWLWLIGYDDLDQCLCI